MILSDFFCQFCWEKNLISVDFDPYISEFCEKNFILRILTPLYRLFFLKEKNLIFSAWMSEIRTRSASKRKQSEDPDWNNQDDRRKRAPALGGGSFLNTFDRY